MLTLDAYFTGPDGTRRDLKYAEELTDEIRANAERTVELANDLLVRAGRSDIDKANSGFRPKAVNDATANAASRSRHLTAEAVDLPDPDGALAEWVMDNVATLKEIGLWAEHPGWTPGWVHVQTCPPGNPPRAQVRIFIPSAKPPTRLTFGRAPVLV